MGRRIREPAARHGSPSRNRTAQYLPHFPAAVQRVQLSKECALDPFEHPLRPGGRHIDAAHHGDTAERLSGDRVHRAVRPGGPERRRHRELFQPTPHRGFGFPAGGN